MELSHFKKKRDGYAQAKFQLALEESYTHPSPFLNAKSISESATLKAKEELDHLFNKFRQGLEVINEETTALSDDDRQSILSSLSKIADDEGERISDQQLAQLSKIAKQIAESGRSEQASCVLLVLTRLAPHNDRLWLELGVIEQKEGNLDTAMVMFMQACYLNPTHPALYLYSSECCLLKGDLLEAKTHLDNATTLIDADRQFEYFKPAVLALASKLFQRGEK